MVPAAIPSVLVIGLSPPGVTACVALARNGLIALSLADDLLVTRGDVPATAIFREEDVGKGRGAVLAKRLKAQYQTNVAPVHLSPVPDEVGAARFGAVIMVNASLDQLISYGEHCRAFNVGFVAIDSRGPVGQLFRDWGGEAYRSYAANMMSPDVGECDNCESRRRADPIFGSASLQRHLALHALHLFRQEQGFLPLKGNADHAGEVNRLAQEQIADLHGTTRAAESFGLAAIKKVDREFCEAVSLTADCKCPPLDVSIGGLAAQEVSHGLLDRGQAVVKGGPQILQLDLRVDMSALGSRAAAARVLVVGSGKVGSEVLRCMACTGFGSADSSRIVVVDRVEDRCEAVKERLMKAAGSSGRAANVVAVTEDVAYGLFQACKDDSNLWSALNGVVICLAAAPPNYGVVSLLSHKCAMYGVPCVWAYLTRQGGGVHVAVPHQTAGLNDMKELQMVERTRRNAAVTVKDFIRCRHSPHAVLAGLAVSELVKATQRERREKMRQSHLCACNLSRTAPTEPIATASTDFHPVFGGPVKAVPESFTLWDCESVSPAHGSIDALLKVFPSTYGVQVTSVSAAGQVATNKHRLTRPCVPDPSSLLWAVWDKGNGKEGSAQVVEKWKELMKQPEGSEPRFIMLDVTAHMPSGGVEVIMPPIKYIPPPKQ